MPKPFDPNNPRTLSEARSIIAQLRASAAPVVVAPKVETKPEAKPTVDLILAKLDAKSITFAEAQAGLQVIAKAAKPAEMNKAFKAIARVQKAEALERLANLPRGKRLI